MAPSPITSWKIDVEKVKTVTLENIKLNERSQKKRSNIIFVPYSCVSLMAQLVQNLPSLRETRVRSLGWEDPLEKGKATHSSFLTLKIPWTV